MPADQRTTPAASAILDTIPLFAGLSAATRERLTARMPQRSYPEGATIFRAGSKPVGVFVVLSGRVRVVRARGGRQYVVHAEGPGGTLAEVPFFAGGLLPATAIAVEPTRCLILDYEALREIMRADPDVAWLFLRRLSGRVRELVERLDSASTRAVPARLAAYLLNRAESVAGESFTLGMTQAELAEELGTVREVVVRGLAKLRRLRVLRSVGRGRYALGDVRALRELVDS